MSIKIRKWFWRRKSLADFVLGEEVIVAKVDSLSAAHFSARVHPMPPMI